MKKTLLSISTLIPLIACTTPSLAYFGEKYYVIQVGACKTATCAQRMLNKFPQHNRLRLLKSHRHNHASVYKIVDGRFSNATQADTVLSKYYPKNNSALVVQMISTSHKAAAKSKTPCSKTKSATKKLAAKKLTKVNKKIKATNSSVRNKITKKPQITVIKAKAASPSFYAKQGSLKYNLIRFSRRYNYKLLWKVVDNDSGLPADFTWVGSTLLQDTPLNMLRSMTEPYNVQTNIWQSNRVICVTNNNSCNN